MYDAQDRRFVAVDWAGSNFTYPQTFNQFAFVINNPLKYIDPNGLELIKNPMAYRL
jgi:RHS repeat-associated protein